MVGVSKRFESMRSDALQSVSCKVASARIAGICGPAGSGKSLILRMLAGRCVPTRGRISILRRDPIRDARELLKDLAWVPSYAAFPPRTSIRDVARLCQDLGGGGDPLAFAQICTALGLDPNVRADKTDSILNFTTSVALALQKSPRVIVADCPDDADGEKLNILLHHMAALKANRVTIVLASRKMELLLPLVDELHLVRDGSIVECIRTRATPKLQIELPSTIDVPAALPSAVPEDATVHANPARFGVIE